MKTAAAALTALTLAAAAAFWRATPAVAFDDVRAAVAAAGDFRVAGRLLREAEPVGGTGSRGYDQPDFIVTEVSDRRRRSDEFDVVVHPGLPAAYEDRPRARALTTTTVVDQDAGLILESNHRDRTARVKLIAENDGAAGYADDWSRYLQDLPTEDAEPLDAGMIGSIRALGFRVSDFPWFQSRQVPAHIWVDEATMLPVQVDVFFRGGTYPKFVFTEFKFGIDIPTERFAFEAPTGYEVALRVEKGARGTTGGSGGTAFAAGDAPSAEGGNLRGTPGGVERPRRCRLRGRNIRRSSLADS